MADVFSVFYVLFSSVIDALFVVVVLDNILADEFLFWGANLLDGLEECLVEQILVE